MDSYPGDTRTIVHTHPSYKRSCVNVNPFGLSTHDRAFVTSTGVEQDWRRAAELYEHACANGSMGSCNNAGLVWQTAYEDRPPNYKQAASYFKMACKGGLKQGCFNLSGMYLNGKGSTISKNMPKALKYSVKSCDLGHAWGCANASRMYRLGDGVKADEKKAKKYKERAKQLQQVYAVPGPHD